MPALVNHLIQLRNGILASRRERVNFRTGLGFESAHRRAAVASLLSRFSSGLHDMARRSRADRAAFLSNLQQAVTALRRGVRAELGGGRLAFERLRDAPGVRALQTTRPKRPGPEGRVQETPRIPKSELRGEETPETGARVQAAETEKRKAVTRRKRRK
jgi:hypothetical protein